MTQCYQKPLTNSQLYTLYLAAYTAFSQHEKVPFTMNPQCHEKPMKPMTGRYGKFWSCQVCSQTSSDQITDPHALWALAFAAAQTDQMQAAWVCSAEELFRRMEADFKGTDHTLLRTEILTKLNATLQRYNRPPQDVVLEAVRSVDNLCDEMDKSLNRMAKQRDSAKHFQTELAPRLEKAEAQVRAEMKSADELLTRQRQLSEDISGTGTAIKHWDEIRGMVRSALNLSVKREQARQDLIGKLQSFAMDLIAAADQHAPRTQSAPTPLSYVVQGFRNIASRMLAAADSANVMTATVSAGPVASKVQALRQDPLIGRADELRKSEPRPGGGSPATAPVKRLHAAKGILPSPLCGAKSVEMTTTIDDVDCPDCGMVLRDTGVSDLLQETRALLGEMVEGKKFVLRWF